MARNTYSTHITSEAISETIRHFEKTAEDASSRGLGQKDVDCPATSASLEPSIQAKPNPMKASVAAFAIRAKEKGCRFASLTAKRDPQTVNTQDSSPLFKLPAELRGMIWENALNPHSRPYDISPAHFHVFQDRVYDACTDDFERKRDLKRGRKTEMPLLLTGRAIYYEAVNFLYGKQPFTIVLCAGFARPMHRVKKRGSMGKMSDLKHVFARMRLVRLVVQPGNNPNLARYKAHVASFLDLLDYRRSLRLLLLDFNFGVYTRVNKEKAIIRAFQHLAKDIQDPARIGPPIHIQTQYISQTANATHKAVLLLEMRALRCHIFPQQPERCSIAFFGLARPTGDYDVDFAGCARTPYNANSGPGCLRYGAWGDYQGSVARQRPRRPLESDRSCRRRTR